jgi:hypothetical protein
VLIYDPLYPSPRWLRLLGIVTLGLVVAGPVQAAEPLLFGEFYTQSVLGMKPTARMTSLTGKQVTVVGAMAPPLKAIGNFFVLTKDPVSLCPFCNSDADWPADILVIYLKSSTTFVQKNRPLAVTGRLEVGSFTDPATGFVSLVRLVDAEYQEK